MTDNHQAEGMTLDTFLGVVRRRVGLILAAIILTAGGVLAYSLLQDEEYSASASLLLRPLGLDQGFGSSLVAPSSTPEREAATNIELATQDIIARRTAARLTREGEPAAATAADDVEVSGKGVSDLAEVKATAPAPQIAARVANAFADEYVAFRRDADRAKIRQAEGGLRRQLDGLVAARTRSSTRASGQFSKRKRSLERRLDDLRILESLQTGNAAVVNRATPPTSPSSPKPVRNTVIGIFVGLLVGLGLALVRDQRDRHLRDSKELERALGLPILARVPESNAFGKKSTLAQDLPAPEAEAFRMLRTNLRYLGPGRNIDSVLVTSASVADGKSTVAFHLASAAAATGLSVLLIEADVRRPTLARSLGLPPGEGLISLLTGERPRLADVAHEVLLTHNGDGGAPAATMDVIPAGGTPPDASELVGSSLMQEVIRQAKQSYAFVVIDTPPVGLVSDAIPLMNEVNAVLVVGRVGRITDEQAGRLRDQLENIDVPTLGIVANFADLDHEGYDLAGYELASPSSSR